MLKSLLASTVLSISVLTSGCVGSATDLETVEFVDVARYAGKWYEIASYPASFQRGCAGTTAEYTLLPDGRVQVFNRCNTGSLDGPEQSILGYARVRDTATNAKLGVSFDPWGLFEGAYWIIDLDPDYQWAVVGEPSRTFLWILSRSPQLDAATYEQIIAALPAKGYDPSRLNQTQQPQPTPN